MPQLVPSQSLSDELDTVAETVRGWLKQTDEPHTIGVLVRSAGARDRVQRGLADRGVQVQTVAGKAFSAGAVPQVLTMHRAKGLEFERVLLASVDESQLPSRWALSDMPDDEREDVANRERFLLYVAATRARAELVVTWHGRPSAFLPR